MQQQAQVLTMAHMATGGLHTFLTEHLSWLSAYINGTQHSLVSYLTLCLSMFVLCNAAAVSAVLQQLAAGM
jgi:hypothetical protein